jgi:hypothetical protein
MHLWARKNQQLDLSVTTPYAQFTMEQGQEIEKIAEEYLLQKFKAFEVITQPTYSTERFLTRPDIVVKNPATDKFDIYEIKSSSSVKKEHKYDITFQSLVCAESIPVGNSYIVHINKEFIKSGDVDLTKFFQITNVNEFVYEFQAEVKTLMEESWKTSEKETSEGIEGCLKPAKCVSKDLCHGELPEHPIYEVSRIGKKARTLLDQGILAIKDIPVGFPLSSKQNLQVRAVKENKVLIDKNGIQELLDKLEYPIYFLDYETFNPAIPYFDGYSSYQQITFQFSLHTLPAPGEEIQHTEFLHDEFSDPIDELVGQLKEHIGGHGSVVVWYKPFEKGRNSDMAALNPKHKEFLENINDRLFDLMDVFNKTLYIDPAFLGSASLKNVLPVLAPDLSYQALTVSNGEMAMLAWRDLIDPEFPEADKAKLHEDMLEYCKLDTFAMVEILKKIQEIISS